jgi:hypothetical protein
MSTSKKCRHCGLVNFATEELCRRCSANLDSAPLEVEPGPGISKSTVYVFLFAFALAGLGVWGYFHKQATDRELAEKAEFVRRQNDYAGHDISTIPPAGAPSPTPHVARFDEQKGYKEAMEKSKEQMESYTK